VSFAVGSLVRARGREWVVLPDSEADFLLLRPLGGTDEEIAGIHAALEAVEPATFGLPDPAKLGDHRSCRLLRDAARISSRAGAGPFRAFSRIAVEPRPYQLVPLLMALRLDPVRLLVADDVGIGKTVEAALIARELLDRGEIQRSAVLCPPHLAEQWHAELNEKFHIDAALVLPSTAGRLERPCRLGESLFEHYPHVIVSMDFIKSESRRQEFLRTCPGFVIVDEAHTCAFGSLGRGRHQRFDLVSELARDAERHLLLVTATPHSGKEDAFRSLLSMLDPSFAELPDDLSGPARQKQRRRLAAHFVQRRRADIRRYLDEDTPFPKRREREETYSLTPEYQRLFERVLAYAREKVRDESGGQHRRRVRWWSALSLLRSLASSPAAAAATLRSRACVADTTTAEEADELGRRAVFDDASDQLGEAIDVAPGADEGREEAASQPEAQPADRRLRELAREADRLQGKLDAKLRGATKHIRQLLAEGFHPIVFCRFIPTAEYLAEHLRRALPRGTQVDAVTGRLPPDEREARILALGEQRAAGSSIVLVCTDCLSEGINLQEHFDAVFHYDLAWNPTRHEQREGRVDRFGQPRPEVRILTYYGIDNAIDGIVLDVLLRKHNAIRSSLGISVPVPVDTNQVVEAIFEGLLLREQAGAPAQSLLPGLEEYLRPQKQDLYSAWESAAQREKRSRTLFAQQTIHVEEVARELEAARRATGSAAELRAFTLEGLRALGARVSERGGSLQLDLSRTSRALRDLVPGLPESFYALFQLPVPEGVAYLSRTHPLVEGLAAHVLDTALDAELEAIAQRAGAIRSAAVPTRTTLLLCRFRFDITTRHGRGRAAPTHSELAEEYGLLAFEGAPQSATWLAAERAEALLEAKPSGNVLAEQARERVQQVIEAEAALRPQLEAAAEERAQALLEAHRRVREAAGLRGISYQVRPQLPVDLLGVYVYLPDPKAGAA